VPGKAAIIGLRVTARNGETVRCRNYWTCSKVWIGVLGFVLYLRLGRDVVCFQAKCKHAVLTFSFLAEMLISR